MQVHETDVTQPRASWTAAQRGPAAAPRRYDVVRPLGAGGMGSVYEARTTVDGWSQRVALKRALPHVHNDPVLRALFVAEARLVAQFDHEALVRPFDVADVAETGHFAMQFIDGSTLAALVRNGLRSDVGLPTSIAVAVAIRAARALAHLHAAGLLHGDLNPSNLMLTRRGSLKLVDFGLAQIANAPPIRRRGLLGTPCYMSPEQVARRRLGRASDMFCLGILLWELTTQRRLFRATTPAEAARRIARCDVPHPARVVPGYCDELATLLMTTLERDPARRLSDANTFADALESYAREFGLDTSTSVLAHWVRQAM